MTDDIGPTPRRAIPRRLRFEILRRDGHTCRYCGAKAPDVKLTVDHVQPVVLGGTDDPTNLVTACADCNSGKTSIAPDSATVADVDATALLFAKAMERVAAERLAAAENLDGLLAWFEGRWYDYLDESGYYRDNLPANWQSSVLAIAGRGITQPELDRFLEIAFRKMQGREPTFRYFAGCCYRELETRQEMARKLVENGEV